MQMLGLRDKINRWRHNRGFGVQSPAAFHFVTEVLKERLPYYSYEQLDKIAKKKSSYSATHCKLLFRITNHVKPKNIISFAADSGSATCALTAARNSATCYIIDAEEALSRQAKEFLANRQCIELYGERITLLQKTLGNIGETGLLHIGVGCEYARATEIALNHVNNNSVIIVEGIHRTNEIKEWWQKIIKHPSTVVTFDMYSMGVIFFDNNYKKQHYTLKMR